MGSSQPTHQHSQPTKLYNYFKQHFTKQVKMKVSQVAAVLAVTASASAAPWKDGKSWGGHWKGGWKNGHEQKCMDGPFEFTSTYSVVATPDQVWPATPRFPQPGSCRRRQEEDQHWVHDGSVRDRCHFQWSGHCRRLQGEAD